MYIETQAELEAFVERAHSSSILAIDTEFLREKTYYPKLCLLQMATDSEQVIVDPFTIDDLKVLKTLLLDESIVKLFHAAHQDLEIIYYDIGCLPKPVFDTQVAAALLGQAQQVGYGALVHNYCGVKLKKADSFTDWSARPLSESQLEYAIDDVLYLPQVYKAMVEELTAKGRLSWLDADFEDMSNPDNFIEDERERFRRLKHVNTLSQRQMAAAREMAAWREIEARKRNIPRKWLLTDEQIVEACKREPRTIDELFMVRGIRDRINTRDARAIMALVNSALDSSPEAWPELAAHTRSERNVDSEVDLLMAIVRIRSKQHGIAIPTLANHADLVKIARGYRDGVDILKGWRKEIVGNELVDALEGRITFSIENGRVRIKHLDN